MPQSPATKELRAAARQLAAARARRDAAVVAMRAEGHTLREVAAAADLTHVAVLKILRAQAAGTEANAV